MSTRPLNLFERAEFLLDSATSATLNFSVAGAYEGELDEGVVRKGLAYLQVMHPLLWMSPNSAQKVTQYVQTNARCPLKTLPYTGPAQSDALIEEELASRFREMDQPLWRATLLKGENQGQLIITFHHAIADGVCAMEMMNHLFSILATLKKGEVPELEGFEKEVPSPQSLYSLSPAQPTEAPPPQIRTAHEYHTGFVHGSIEAQRAIDWTKTKNIRMNGTLFAALLLAIERVISPNFCKWHAASAVNFRPYFDPPVAKGQMALMRTLLAEEFLVGKQSDFTRLARRIHQSLNTQLKTGRHVDNLKVLEQQLERGISANELWKRVKLPENGAIVTNLGKLDFSGDYGNLSLTALSFFANIVPFLDKANHFVLGAVTFRGKISLCLWFIKELVEESAAQNVLKEIESILSSL